MTEQVELDHDDASGLTLHEIVAILLDARWLILAVTAVVTLLGTFYAMSLQHVYRADALVQVEENAPELPGLVELSQRLGGTSSSQTIAEIEILQSRSLAMSVARRHQLQVVTQPRYMPVIGQFIANRYNGDGVNEAWLGQRRYAWGGEELIVSRLETPDGGARSYRLRALEGSRYELLDTSGAPIVVGQVGELSTGGGVEIFVETLRAAPGTEFDVYIRSLEASASAVRGSLSVFEKHGWGGMLELSYEDSNPERAARVLNALVDDYVRQNVERRSEEAARMIGFINEQLPVLRSDLDIAEAELDSFRAEQGSVDLSAETRAVLDSATALHTRQNELELDRVQLMQRYTESHPAVVALDLRLRQVQGEMDQLNEIIRGLPELEREALRLQRDVRAANELYMLLLGRGQELRIVRAGATGNIRIIDRALEPTYPIRPDRRFISQMSLMLGLMLGAALALALKLVSRGIEDPVALERRLGLPVYAVISHSRKQAEIEKNPEQSSLLAAESPDEITVEAIRGLRTALQFGLLEAANNIVVIGGATASVGKSFVASNLAAVIADAGKRTILIDADLRRGHLNQYFHKDRDPGLSQVISGDVTLDEVIHPAVYPGVDFIATGVIPPNPSELLLHERFAETVQELSNRYDLVVLDVPPVLAVTDAIIVGRLAAVNFLLVRFGVTTMQETRLAVSRLNQAGIHPQGLIMNGMPERVGYYGQYKYGYQYTYTYKK